MSQCDEDRSIYNGHFEIEIVIDRPLQDVWSQFVNIPSWVISHDIEQVSGQPGCVGSVMRVYLRGAKEEGCHYSKLIKLVPGRQWLLKTYSEKGDAYQMTGFDDGRLVAMEGKTKAVFNLYIEIKGEAVAADPSAINLDASRETMVKNLSNLKQILEGR
jgi:hypothetical protein